MKSTLEKPYHVYFFICPAHIPFHFAVHPWVVTISPTKTDRFEIIHRQSPNRKHFGYIYKNYYRDPKQGIKKHPTSYDYWSSTEIAHISGDENSIAREMVDFIQTHSPDYIYKDTYHIFPGPNSNTYIQWILSKFPETKITLPWNAFGKKYLK